jgi:hypothetical protein
LQANYHVIQADQFAVKWRHNNTGVIGNSCKNNEKNVGSVGAYDLCAVYDPSSYGSYDTMCSKTLDNEYSGELGALKCTDLSNNCPNENISQYPLGWGKINEYRLVSQNGGKAFNPDTNCESRAVSKGRISYNKSYPIPPGDFVPFSSDPNQKQNIIKKLQRGAECPDLQTINNGTVPLKTWQNTWRRDNQQAHVDTAIEGTPVLDDDEDVVGISQISNCGNAQTESCPVKWNGTNRNHESISSSINPEIQTKITANDHEFNRSIVKRCVNIDGTPAHVLKSSWGAAPNMDRRVINYEGQCNTCSYYYKHSTPWSSYTSPESTAQEINYELYEPTDAQTFDNLINDTNNDLSVDSSYAPSTTEIRQTGWCPPSICWDNVDDADAAIKSAIKNNSRIPNDKWIAAPYVLDRTKVTRDFGNNSDPRRSAWTTGGGADKKQAQRITKKAFIDKLYDPVSVSAEANNTARGIWVVKKQTATSSSPATTSA